MMKVLHLNTFDAAGGAARAASRLNSGLLDLGVDSRMLVQCKITTSDSVIDGTTLWGRLLAKLRPHLDALPARLYPKRMGMFFFPSLLPDRVSVRTSRIDPDIVNLHWLVGGFIKVESLENLKRPLVWTLHDSWPFTGGCLIPYDCMRYREACGRCPVLGSSREFDLSRRVWLRKQKAWENLDLTVVAPSCWLADCARASSLFRNRRIEIIPNGLDLDRFQPYDKVAARESLQLPQGKRLILFGAKYSTTDRNKGFHLLVKALRRLAADGRCERAEVIIFGSEKMANTPDLGFRTRYMGWLDDDIILARLYSAADVFVFPSIQEALGYTVMEAMACGTPCVAFDQGGVPDLIEHERTGYLARNFQPDDLASGIDWVLKDEGRRDNLSTEGRRKVEQEFGQDMVANRYLSLYEELSGGRKA